MRELVVRVRAPFAAFRGMQAGVYRTTAPVIPFSAAWGLLLNFAAIETRKPAASTTLVDPAAPPLELAIGAVRPAAFDTLYQQLHSYRVGTDKKTKELAALAHGAKYWIQPVRRELLLDLDCLIAARGDDQVVERVAAGIRGDLDGERYGLPFAGDNNLLIDRVDVLHGPVAAAWYTPIKDDDPPRPGSCRLTVGIDRADSSRTTTLLCAPTPPSPEVPSDAWIWTPRAP